MIFQGPRPPLWPGLPLAFALAWLLARGRFPGKILLDALVHLPLVLPGPARFRVGNQERAWRLGEAWVFDDTIEHEAWNDADQLRVILIIDVWNPFLSEAERELVNTMFLAARTYLDGA